MVALLALADMPPPALMAMFTELAPISSMTWMVNVLCDEPRTRDGWWLLQSRAENASQGYSSQDMLVWNRDGELVIAGRQNVAIFA
jgi:acyl-CoA thioesterase